MTFDFNKLYLAYPRHEGKRAGMQKLAKEIKTTDDYQRFSRAVENYSKLCLREGRQKKYTLLWQTFCNGRWEDYVDMPGGPDDGSQLARIMKGEL